MGPFGITQVDVPAALNAYMSGQDRRTMQMQRLRAEEKERLAAENADKTSMAYAKLFAPKGGGQASGGVASAYPTAEATPPPQMGQPAMEPAPQAAPMDDPLFDPQARQEFLSTIATIDGPQALELRSKFMQMDKDRLEAVVKTSEQVAKVALGLSQVPEAQRAAEVQRLLPALRQMGLDDEILATPDLSDRGLSLVINQARDVENIYKSLTPGVVPVPGVGLFPSPVQTPFGNNTPQNLPRPASAAERDALPEGAQYIAPDGSIMQKGGGGGQSAASGFSEWY
jgi:hypothetical protein